MLKPNYCEVCKFQFKGKQELLNHIQQSHQAGSKVSNPSPTDTRLMDDADLLSKYIVMSKTTRDVFGLTRIEHGGEVSILNHELFMRLDNTLKERVKKAIELANRRIKK